MLPAVRPVVALRARQIPPDRRAEAGAVWQALEDERGTPQGPCSWTWTRTWLEHYGDVVGHRFVVGEQDGRPRAIALVTAGARSRWRPRTRHVGTAGEPRGSGVFVERNRLLAAPGHGAAFAELLAAELDADAGWDRLLLDGMTQAGASALLARWPDARITVEESPVADLTGGDDVLDQLSASRRRRLRATLRAFGPLQLDWAADAGAGSAILEELIDLHQRHWEARGEPGAFASARFAAFHRAVAPRLVAEGGAALVRVRRGAETIGCLYGLVEGSRLLFYQGGLRLYPDNRLRSGQAAHVLFMRAARDRGLTEYDLLAPASRYKLELATHREPLVWAEVDRARWRTRTSVAARRLRAA